jgi:ribosome-binding protein aMBF1 (putative translation factor)
MISAAQIKTARDLLGWSRDRLAPKVGMCANRLRKLEIGLRSLSEDEVRAISAALEAAGVAFTDGEPGVRLKTASTA